MLTRMNLSRRSRLWSGAAGLGALCAAAALAISSLLSGCDDGSCSDEQKFALELHINNPDNLKIVPTAELDHEEVCGFFFDPAQGIIYTCYEQGAGTYKLRVYTRAAGQSIDEAVANGDVIYEDEIPVEKDGCHAKLVVVDVDLTGLAPAND